MNIAKRNYIVLAVPVLFILWIFWAVFGQNVSQKTAQSIVQASNVQAAAQPPLPTPSSDLKAKSVDDIAKEAQKMKRGVPEQFLVKSTEYANGTKYIHIMADIAEKIAPIGLKSLAWNVHIIEENSAGDILVEITRNW